ncbi:MAG: ABC transporter permease [Legionellaceae bacterium]|nr:ABC transporter permease [Legionellaceae bacterium]
MWFYLWRRVAYLLPILLGIHILTFTLFFMVNTPDDIARMQLGQKYITAETIMLWKQQHGYDLPLFYDAAGQGVARLTHTLFFKQTQHLFSLNFGVSDAGRNIADDIHHRMWPSLAIAVPSLFLGLIVQIGVAIMLVFFRSTALARMGMGLCMILMSISGLFYIVIGQYWFGKVLRLVPISGYHPGWAAVKFVLLPIVVSVVAGLGANVRWYRALLLDQVDQDYVKTALSKGVSEWRVLRHHVLRNSLLPIVTNVVVVLPSLFLGSLVLESFFGIPGLGSYMIDAIQQQDFAIVRAMVFLGSFLYIIGLLLTDVVYVLVDPRIRFE